MENVLTQLYDSLSQLRYPEIAKIDSKDLATVVLAGHNRITLLTWLLSRASPTLSTHLEKFQGQKLKEEIVKSYFQMGITNDESVLLGNCCIQKQLSFLKALFLFTKSLDSTDNLPDDESVVCKILDELVNKPANIIPATFHVSTKLTKSKVKKYLDEVGRSITEATSVSPVRETAKVNALAIKDEIDSDDALEIENGQTLSLESMAVTFSTAFASAEFVQNTKQLNTTTEEILCIDETIQNLCKDLNSFAQIFESKESILGKKLPESLEKSETPLSLLIQDNVILSEEIRKLYDHSHLEN
ncbi:uncharacterized protein LOC124406986 [Diprion similis]|uniref:uncharacterized protein LOC124406986 n=1 Tax=Diprion similis TaxID=362088 RepID=UPI001EF85434|nr:uncharacterized protein LOC124406986 [Diprion similis]XP_046738694.1 uncharacterized protein LOC124406986 [Diprion similis]XP_046738695.1 uncharacterized protein LOC124406986 [Diprion similis]XP_046738696.1 uncharacterized protein LOC124406986 [Diprion similis]XP_046738699.1 uncharacterized protein LOC124406986 [Diprion similis]